MNLVQVMIERLKYGDNGDLAVLGLLVVCVLWLISRAPLR